jgi:pimeloyl-ACP methyl ester carboxylesterase
MPSAVTAPRLPWYIVSPRRRLLVLGLAAVLLVVAVLVGVRVAGERVSGGHGPEAGRGGPPAPDRPGPVLLVPGYGGGRDGLIVLAGRIHSATGRAATVLTLPGDGTGDLGAQVAVLDAAAQAAIAAGAPSVDVVGFSAGGVVAGLWVARSPDTGRARRVISLGSPLHGVQLAGVGAALAPESCPPACRQLAPGSDVMGELERAGLGARVPWLSVWTAEDETVSPQSARLTGAVNIELQSVCPDAHTGHGQLPTDPLVAGLVLRALGTEPLHEPAAAECATLRNAGR